MRLQLRPRITDDVRCALCHEHSGGHGNRIGLAKGTITAFETALDLYEADCGAYPTTTQGLEALRTAPSPRPDGWKGPYLKKEIPLDPWGNPYQYLSPGTHHPQGVDIWSKGVDGVEGTADDVQNWNQRPSVPSRETSAGSSTG